MTIQKIIICTAVDTDYILYLTYVKCENEFLLSPLYHELKLTSFSNE